MRHRWPPEFAPPPGSGPFVLIQPWEFGRSPKAWVRPITERVDEVWCYSRAVLRAYVASGMPESRLSLVPPGVDPDRFRPGQRPQRRPDRLLTRPAAGEVVREVPPGSGDPVQPSRVGRRYPPPGRGTGREPRGPGRLVLHSQRHVPGGPDGRVLRPHQKVAPAATGTRRSMRGSGPSRGCVRCTAGSCRW